MNAAFRFWDTAEAELTALIETRAQAYLRRGEPVRLSSFGSFVVRERRQRLGRNPKTGRQVKIPARRVLVFKPSAILKARINSQR